MFSHYAVCTYNSTTTLIGDEPEYAYLLLICNTMPFSEQTSIMNFAAAFKTERSWADAERQRFCFCIQRFLVNIDVASPPLDVSWPLYDVTRFI